MFYGDGCHAAAAGISSSLVVAVPTVLVEDGSMSLNILQIFGFVRRFLVDSCVVGERLFCIRPV